MEPVVHLIVRKPFDDIPESYWTWVKSHCEKVLVAQHDADDDVKTTHCHAMIVKPTHSDVTWQNARRENGIGGHMSIMLQKIVKSEKKYEESYLGCYILKGDNETLRMIEGYSDEEIEQFIRDWVDHSSDKKDDKVIKKSYDEWDEIKKDYLVYFNNMNKPHVTLDGIRTWCMRWYWKRDGRMPPAQAYKRNAASLYVYSCELSNRCLDAAFEELKELWY